MTEKGSAASKRRIFTREFKLQVLREIEAGTKTQAQASREYQLSETAIYNWRKLYAKYKAEAFAGQGHAYTAEARVGELERMVGRLTMENDFLKKLLQKLESES
jgi:transposase